MNHPAANLTSILRAGFLVLLALGVMVRPMLNQLSALHNVEHAVLAGAGDHGHDHPGQRGQAADSDHATDGHALLHQADTVSSANIWTPWVSLSAIPAASTLPLADLASTRPQRLSSPFRPPIA